MSKNNEELINVKTQLSEKLRTSLYEGVKKFRKEDYRPNESMYQELDKNQYPHTLFIGCSDSRVIPNLITRSLPGELFIVRNIANLVPYYDIEHNTYTATAAAIEYAVNVLQVENIIVCGHSNCGGCGALYSRKDLTHLPLTKKWLELALPVKSQVKEKLLSERSTRNKRIYTEQLNVVEQMRHLLTYPYIKEKFDRGELNILGWYFVIKSGEMYHYVPEKDAFEPI